MQDLINKIVATWPDPLPLNDDEFAKLSAYLKTHRQTVSLSAMQRARRGDKKAKKQQAEDKKQWGALRLTLEYNRERRGPNVKESTAATANPNTPDARALNHENIRELEKITPALDTQDGLWVKNKLAGQLESVNTRTLADYRQDGVANTDKTFGRDKDGRIWRRRGTAGSHPWYLRSTLISSQSKRVKP